jgi:hypothetical protein
VFKQFANQHRQILGGGNIGAKFRPVFVQIFVVQVRQDAATDQVVEDIAMNYLTGCIREPFHGYVQYVIVTVPVRVVAFAV